MRAIWWALGLAAGLMGCEEQPYNAGENWVAYDNDNDGAADDMDCDPADPAVGPAIRYAPDNDGDGWGTYTGSTAYCPGDPAIPVGYVTLLHDCDDEDASVHPDAEEIACDGLDNDCDDATPDGDDCDTGG